MYKSIKRNDGKIVKFNSREVTSDILRIGRSTREMSEAEAKELTRMVLTKAYLKRIGPIPMASEIRKIIIAALKNSPSAKKAQKFA